MRAKSIRSGRLGAIVKVLKSQGLHLTRTEDSKISKEFLFEDASRTLFLLRTSGRTRHSVKGGRYIYEAYPVHVKLDIDFEYVIVGLFDKESLCYILKAHYDSILHTSYILLEHKLYDYTDRWQVIYP